MFVFTFWGLKAWSVICLPGEIYGLFDAHSSGGEKILLAVSASGPFSTFREPHRLNPYQAVYV